ncbi:MAG: amino acid ABC transporter permease [Candidimonas sp.]|nr:MAG: amino acid ABC transporter permease [Candidimonas sp.]TAM25387.1 MAG: amino acid ABC transporter permease [Candidimonas sp.]
MYQWDWSVITTNWPLFGWGLLKTIEIVVITMATSLVTGLLMAILRMSKNRLLSGFSYWYIEIFRNTPLLLQLYIVYRSAQFGSFLAGYIALTLNLTAFLAEIFRSGLSSIDKQQWEAGLSLGMTSKSTLRRIIIPQAVRRIVPPLGTYWVSLFRDSALVAYVGVAELTHAAQEVSVNTYRPFEAFTALAIFYIVLTYPQARIVAWIHEKVRIHE